MWETGRRARVLALVLAGATAMAACGAPGEETEDPAKAVKDFLTDGLVDRNGFEACGYLTPAERRAVVRRGRTSACRDAFDSASLILGGRQIDQEHEVNGLTATSAVDGSRARVRLSRGSASVTFELVKADYAEREEFEPPATDWRIAGGALRVIP